jgi:hypothetical protein
MLERAKRGDIMEKSSSGKRKRVMVNDDAFVVQEDDDLMESDQEEDTSTKRLLKRIDLKVQSDYQGSSGSVHTLRSPPPSGKGGPDPFRSPDSINDEEVIKKKFTNEIMTRALLNLEPHKIPDKHETECVFCMNGVDKFQDDERAKGALNALIAERFNRVLNTNEIWMCKEITRSYNEGIRVEINAVYEAEIKRAKTDAERSRAMSKMLPRQEEMTTYIHFCTLMHQRDATNYQLIELSRLYHIQQQVMDTMWSTPVSKEVVINGEVVGRDAPLGNPEIEMDTLKVYLTLGDRIRRFHESEFKNPLFCAPQEIEANTKKSLSSVTNMLPISSIVRKNGMNQQAIRKVRSMARMVGDLKT